MRGNQAGGGGGAAGACVELAGRRRARRDPDSGHPSAVHVADHLQHGHPRGRGDNGPPEDGAVRLRDEAEAEGGDLGGGEGGAEEVALVEERAAERRRGGVGRRGGRRRRRQKRAGKDGKRRQPAASEGCMREMTVIVGDTSRSAQDSVALREDVGEDRLPGLSVAVPAGGGAALSWFQSKDSRGHAGSSCVIR